MGIWDTINNIEMSKIHSLEQRGKSCIFDETSEDSIKVEKEYLAQYKRLSKDIEHAIINSDDYKDGSLNHLEDDSLMWFTKDGECCIYSPRMRSDLRNIDVRGESEAPMRSLFKKGTQEKECKVAVIGPWYSSDKSFTDQYKREAKKMAEQLDGNFVVINDENADILAISDAIENNELVIFDSHGISLNGTTYICLTSANNITKEDYLECHAVNGGNWIGVDGTAICNHLKDKTIKCKLLWMAMCEGMKKSGRGGMSIPLKNIGVDVIYGYSQSISFYGDYLYEECFFNCLRKGATISEAFEKMTDKFGSHDPAFTTTASAYPIVVSDEDDFPENPDCAQKVKSSLILLKKPKTLLENLKDGVICKKNYTTKTRKSIFDLYIFNKKIGKISINRNFSDDSVDDLDGTLVFKENEKWTS